MTQVYAITRFGATSAKAATANASNKQGAKASPVGTHPDRSSSVQAKKSDVFATNEAKSSPNVKTAASSKGQAESAEKPGFSDPSQATAAESARKPITDKQPAPAAPAETPKSEPAPRSEGRLTGWVKEVLGIPAPLNRNTGTITSSDVAMLKSKASVRGRITPVTLLSTAAALPARIGIEAARAAVTKLVPDKAGVVKKGLQMTVNAVDKAVVRPYEAACAMFIGKPEGFILYKEQEWLGSVDPVTGRTKDPRDDSGNKFLRDYTDIAKWVPFNVLPKIPKNLQVVEGRSRVRWRDRHATG